MPHPPSWTIPNPSRMPIHYHTSSQPTSGLTETPGKYQWGGTRGICHSRTCPCPPSSKIDQSPNPGLPVELLNLDLCSLLAALAQQNQPHHQKKHRGICEPDTFSSRTADDLHAFIFQYQIYFRACKDEFKEDSKKVYFTISYLWGIALDYFEPYINEPNPMQSFDFLEGWLAFVQKFSNIFGSYSPEDDCHELPLWLSPFLSFFSLLFYFLFIAWESLSHYVTQGVTMSHHGHGHKSRHMVTW